MDYTTLLLPLLIIVALLAGLAVLKRRLFDNDPPAPPPPLPVPDAQTGRPEAPRASPAAPPRGGNGAGVDVSLSPARLYPARLLPDTHVQVFSRLLKSLPGYVVLPRITYDHFLEARDGTSAENTSLRNRAAGHLADFLVCDRKLNPLLVCQVDDGRELPARIQEREKMLAKAGLRLLRWKPSTPPEPAALLGTVQAIEKLSREPVSPTRH